MVRFEILSPRPCRWEHGSAGNIATRVAGGFCFSSVFEHRLFAPPGSNGGP